MKIDWFDAFKLNSWQEAGMTITPVAGARKRTFLASINGGLIALLMSLAPLATGSELLPFPNVPAEHMQVWYSAYPFDSVRKTLAKLGSLGQNWNGHESVAPVAESIRAMALILDQLPFQIEPKVGVDGDGYVFLHFGAGEKHAYLTIEPAAAHLVTMVKGQPSEYIADQPLKGNELPAGIAQKLASMF